VVYLDRAWVHRFFSQWAKGATDSLWLTGGQTFAVFFVVVLSVKYGEGGFSKTDFGALVAAGIGLLLWYFTSDAIFALAMVILVDSVGSLLTVVKVYRDPKSETLSTWLMSGTSGIFGSLAVGSLNPILLAYPLYLVIANYAIVGAKLLGERRQA
jgi:hypothetical protein